MLIYRSYDERLTKLYLEKVLKTAIPEASEVAFIVCHAFGIDSTNRRSDYIQHYDGTTKTLTESLTFIQSTAEWMIDAINRTEITCDHASNLRNSQGGLNGSWIKDDSVQPAKFLCGVCGKFYG